MRHIQALHGTTKCYLPFGYVKWILNGLYIEMDVECNYSSPMDGLGLDFKPSMFPVPVGHRPPAVHSERGNGHTLDRTIL